MSLPVVELVPIGQPTVKRLTNGDFNDQVLAYLFGELVQLASPFVTNYHSDLFRDAEYLQKFVTGPATFFYRVRPYGTHIGTDLSLVAQGFDPLTERLYRVELAQTDRLGWWEMTLTRLGPEGLVDAPVWPEVPGVPQGMGLFIVHPVVETMLDGWSGSQQYPTFFTVGGNENDAAGNAGRILGLEVGSVLPSGAKVVRIEVTASRVA